MVTRTCTCVWSSLVMIGSLLRASDHHVYLLSGLVTRTVHTNFDRRACLRLDQSFLRLCCTHSLGIPNPCAGPSTKNPSWADCTSRLGSMPSSDSLWQYSQCITLPLHYSLEVILRCVGKIRHCSLLTCDPP